MKIDIHLQTKVGDLLDDYPALEEKLIELSPAFAKLRNPILRRTIAKVTSLQQAAAIAKIPPAQFVQELRKAAGLSVTPTDTGHEAEEVETMPDWYDESRISIRFDARPLIESGRPPLQEIISLANNLEKGAIMQVLTPFKTVPVIDILKSKTFRVWIRNEHSFFVIK